MNAKPTLYCFPLFVSITLMGLIIVPFSVKSQNKIYLEAGSIEGKLNEVTRDRVKFTRPENPGPLYSVKRNSVKIIFNESGNFLIPEALDQFGNTSEDASVADFINSSGSLSDATDKIFTLNNKEFSGKIINEDPSSFTINTGRQTPLKIKRSEVACVVYKSGKHQLIASVSASVDALKNIANNKASLAFQPEITPPAPAITEEKKEEPKKEIPKVIPEPQKEITPPTPVVTEEKKEEPKKETPKVIPEPQKEITPPAPAITEEKKEEPKKETPKVIPEPQKEITPPTPVVTREKKEEPVKEIIEKPKPVEKVDSVKIKLMLDKQYDSLVSLGNRLLLLDMQASLAAFKKILEIRSTDYYASKQIRYLEGEIARKEQEKRIEEEKRRIEDAENRYKEAIKKGDRLKMEKNYEDALTAYKEALAIHPEDAYLKRMVDILTYQLSLKKNPTEENKP